MKKQIRTVKCTHVVAQISLGYYDAAGNLIGEEMFPQSDGSPLVAKLFYPHAQELTALIEMCVEQAWETLHARGQADRYGVEGNGATADESEPGEREIEEYAR